MIKDKHTLIALQAVYYQFDCEVYELQEATYRNGKNLNKRNRMGTENYMKTDYQQLTDSMTFD